eukprot:scaffold1900_cov123-Cylindrotheca_fusiformis.AAC.18
MGGMYVGDDSLMVASDTTMAQDSDFMTDASLLRYCRSEVGQVGLVIQSTNENANVKKASFVHSITCVIVEDLTSAQVGCQKAPPGGGVYDNGVQLGGEVRMLGQVGRVGRQGCSVREGAYRGVQGAGACTYARAGAGRQAGVFLEGETSAG